MLKPEHQFLLPQTNALALRMQAAFSKAVGMHASRFRVLFLLHVQGESTPSALLRKTIMDAAALTRVLKDFEAEGLVSRRPDPLDARQTLVMLTDKGQGAIHRHLSLRDRFVEDALEGLSEAEMQTLARLLERLEANLSRIAGLPAVGRSLNIDPERASD